MVGPAGDDGSLIFAGEGPPPGEIGNHGDFYLDQSTGELYGPKDETAGWGDSVSLSGSDGIDGQDGEDGQDGKDGSQIYAGNGPPAGSLGNVGDYYLDTDNYELYGPKTGRNWDTPIKLQGPPGTANVFYSEWLQIDWNIKNDPDDKTMFIEEPRVAGEFIDIGAVLVYYRTDQHVQFPSAGALPYATYTMSISYSISDYELDGIDYQGIAIRARQRDGTLNPPPLPQWVSNIEIRYVLIPGGVPTGKIQEKFWDNYEKVADYFGIPD